MNPSLATHSCLRLVRISTRHHSTAPLQAIESCMRRWRPREPDLCVRRTARQTHGESCYHSTRRHFASSTVREAKAKPSRARPTKPNTLPKSSTSTPRPNTAAPKLQAYAPLEQQYALHLTSQSGPTPLYIAPKSAAYPVLAYTVGGFCLTYGIYNLSDAVLVPHPGLWWGISGLMAVVSIVMGGIGTRVIWGVRKLARRVDAVPLRSLHSSTPSLGLRIEPRRILRNPFRPRTLLIPLFMASAHTFPTAQLSTSVIRAVVDDSSMLSEGELRQLERRHTAERALAQEKNVLRRAVLVSARAVANTLGAFRRLVARDGFVELWVRSDVALTAGLGPDPAGSFVGKSKRAKWQRFTLDVRGGWIAGIDAPSLGDTNTPAEQAEEDADGLARSTAGVTTGTSGLDRLLRVR